MRSPVDAPLLHAHTSQSHYGAAKVVKERVRNKHLGSVNRRRQIMTACVVVGLGVPFVCYLLVLGGTSNDKYHLDKVAVLAVLFAVWSPLVAFVPNPDERGRTLKEQLLDLAYYWYFANTFFQTFWELGWFVNKNKLMSGTITEHDRFYWPWYAYGMCDTRYLNKNDLVLSISAMDASIALPEVVGMYLAFQGYAVLTSWIGLILTACEAWGQFYFYVDELYKNFSDIEDRPLGLWLKLVALNLPWLIFCFLGCAGFMWNLSDIYKQRGVELYLEDQRRAEQGKGVVDEESDKDSSSVSAWSFERQCQFAKDTDMYLKVDDVSGRHLGVFRSPCTVRLVYFIMVFPWVFLLVDWLVYAKHNGFF